MKNERVFEIGDKVKDPQGINYTVIGVLDGEFPKVRVSSGFNTIEKEEYMFRFVRTSSFRENRGNAYLDLVTARAAVKSAELSLQTLDVLSNITKSVVTSISCN